MEVIKKKLLKCSCADLCVYVSFGYVHKWIDSYSKSVFGLIRNCPTIFQSDSFYICVCVLYVRVHVYMCTVHTDGHSYGYKGQRLMSFLIILHCRESR